MTKAETDAHPSFAEAFKVWLKIGCINFGGPAAQIALMHHVVVDEKKWVDEARFLHALNFCMLLPGAFVMLGLSMLYALGRGVPLIDGALFGIKAAVLVIVIEALIRISRRALKTSMLLALAAAA